MNNLLDKAMFVSQQQKQIENNENNEELRQKLIRLRAKRKQIQTTRQNIQNLQSTINKKLSDLKSKRQIVVEAVFLTIIAGLIGVISGGLLLMLIDKVAGQGVDAILVNASVSIAVIFAAIVILVILGTLIGLIPAFKATSIKPIDALREE